MLNIFAKFNKKLILLKLNYKAHVVNNLSANMFIDIDTLDSHEIIINVVKSQTMMNVCQDAIIDLLVKLKVNHQIQFVYNKQ